MLNNKDKSVNKTTFGKSKPFKMTFQKPVLTKIKLTFEFRCSSPLPRHWVFYSISELNKN